MKYMQSFERRFLCVVIATLCGGEICGSAVARAQGQGGLEEVIVTAQKREENIQSVPLSISALTADDLAQKGITSLNGIAQATPSITFTQYNNSSNTLTVYMRGQGFIDPGQLTADGAVGLYEDGFYISRPQAATFDLADVERVEVLRGPQGTLYGRNTTGGAVNLISKQPSGEFGFKQSFTYGTRNQFRSLTAVDLPKWGDVSSKVSILRSSIDGYVRNLGSSHDYGEESQQAGRIALQWDAAENIAADYFFEKGDIDSTPSYYQSPALNGLPLYDTATPYHAKDDPASRTYRPIDLNVSRSDFEGHGLTVTWDVNDDYTLKSLTGYRALNWDAWQDYAEVFGMPYATNDRYDTHQFSQELQFVGSIAEPQIDYVVGLYYFDESGSHANTLNLSGMGLSQTNDVNAESKSKAAFGQLTWVPKVLDEKLEFTLGARYTRDDKSASRRSFNNLIGVTEDGARTGSTNDQSFSRFNPAFTASYHPMPDATVYLRVATGYKAGGSLESAPPGGFNHTFDPEEVKTYELGYKSYAFDHRMRLNVAAFVNQIDDLQLLLGADPYATYFQAYNAGEATTEGVELDLQLAPIDDLSINLQYTYLHSAFDSVDVIPGTTFDRQTNPASPYGPGDNLKDLFRMPYSPRHSLNLSADYTVFHFEGGSVSTHLDYRWQSEIYLSPPTGSAVPRSSYFSIPSYGLLNGRVTLALDLPRGDHVDVSVWGTNLARKKYYQSVVAVGVGPVPIESVDPVTGGAMVVPAGFTSQAVVWSAPPAYGLDVVYRY